MVSGIRLFVVRTADSARTRYDMKLGLGLGLFKAAMMRWRDKILASMIRFARVKFSFVVRCYGLRLWNF